MSDCFGPEAGGSATRPASPTTANDLWAVGESDCGAGDGSYILGLINSIIANLRNICRAAAGQTLINDDPCDSVIVTAIRQLPCTATPANAAQLAALKATPADATVLVCIGGQVVAVPADCFGSDGGSGTDPVCDLQFSSSTDFTVVTGPVIVCIEEILPNPGSAIIYRSLPTGTTGSIGQFGNINGIGSSTSAPPATAPLLATRNEMWQQGGGENNEVEYRFYCGA